MQKHSLYCISKKHFFEGKLFVFIFGKVQKSVEPHLYNVLYLLHIGEDAECKFDRSPPELPPSELNLERAPLLWLLFRVCFLGAICLWSLLNVGHHQAATTAVSCHDLCSRSSASDSNRKLTSFLEGASCSHSLIFRNVLVPHLRSDFLFTIYMLHRSTTTTA